MTAVVPGIGTAVTANDIIRRAALALGYLGRNGTLSAGDANDGLDCLNTMLDSWNGESLLSFVINEQFFVMAVNKAQYTIGTVGTPDINNTRPTDIVQAYIRDFNDNDYPLSIVPRDKWNLIGQKNITSQIPLTLFYDSQYPLGVINLFPQPLIGYTVYYDAITQQNTFVSLATQLAMPVGYTWAYVSNLALVMMAAGFPCMLDPDAKANLAKQAADAKANVKRLNMKEVISDYDSAIVSQSYATYNVFSDTFGRAS